MQYNQKEKEEQKNEVGKENSEYSEYRKNSSTSLNERHIGSGEKLTGYAASEQERMSKNNPKEVKRMENSFGLVAFGKNRKKEMVMAIAGKGNHRPTLPNSTKELEAESAVRLNRLSDHFYANSHDREESALAYKVSYNRSPRLMLERLKNMVAKQDVYMEKDILPFLREKAMKEQKKQLNELLRNFVEAGDKDGKERVEQALQELRENIKHREREEKKFLNHLEGAVELMRKEKTTEDALFFHKFQANPAPASEEGNGADETDETPPLDENEQKDITKKKPSHYNLDRK